MRSSHLIATTGIAALGLLLSLPGESTAQSSDTFPKEAFNGMQIVYSVSGGEVTSCEDRPGFSTIRTCKGKLGSGKLRISGTARMGGGFGADVVVTLTAGGRTETWKEYIKSGWPGFNEKKFDLSLPIGETTASGSFSINMTGHYNVGTRGLSVRGYFSMPVPIGTQDLHDTVVPTDAALLKILQLFERRIPRGTLGSGNINNILSWFSDAYSPYVCGGYQGQVLNLLDSLRFSADPKERDLLKDWDYGPIQAYWGGHQAVVIYPRGKNWVEDGIVLDPWPTQSPKWYPMAQWAITWSGGRYLGGSYYGISHSKVYEANPEYPTVGGNYVDPKMRNLTKDQLLWLGSLPEKERDRFERIKDRNIRNMLINIAYARRDLTRKVGAQCPLNVHVVDAQGRISGFPDGKPVADIPGVLINRFPLADGTYWTEIDIPRNLDVKLVMTGSGAGKATVFTGFNMQADPSSRTIHKVVTSVAPGQQFSLAKLEPTEAIRTGDQVLAPAPAVEEDAKTVPKLKAPTLGGKLLVVHERDAKTGVQVQDALSEADARDTSRTGSYCKVFLLNAREGEEFIITMDSTEIDSFLRVENLEGKELGRDDDSGGERNARLVFRAPATGMYKVFATTFTSGSTGAFTLKVVPRMRGVAVALEWQGKESAAEGKLAFGDEMDAVRRTSFHKAYTVKLEAGRNYVIELTSTQFDTFLRLEDAAGKELAFNDDGGDGTNSRLRFRPEQSGTYRIIVTSYHTRVIGNYLLKVREE